MLSFIITFAIMSIIGLFFGSMFTIDIKGPWKRGIATAVIAFAIGGLITGMLTIESIANTTAWNNGVCPNCSKEWRLVNVDHLRNNGDRYHFICDNCGKLISTDYYMGG